MQSPSPDELPFSPTDDGWTGPQGADAPPESRRAHEPTIVPAEGRIRREALDPNAVFVVKHLQRMGHEAYLVGGCVRDLLLGLEPKDFDVATDATPQRVKRLFRSAFIIGRRFRLVHVRFPNGQVVETATFRADPGTLGRDPERPDRADGPIYDDNVFGTAESDAWRRDFSVNALFYDPVRDEVVDYVDGLRDLESRTIRALGDPRTRICEDPVRMIRAVHFAARLGGTLEPALSAAIAECAVEIEKASRSRLYVELVKVLGRGAARETMKGLHDFGVLRGWLPELVAFLDRPIAWPAAAGGTHAAAREGEPEDTPSSHLTWNLLGAGDAWGLSAHGVPESLMLAPLLGPWLLDTFERGPRRGRDLRDHVEELFRPIAVRMNVPRRTSWELREILGMFERLRHPPPDRRRAEALVHRPIFPEALVYLELDLRARNHDLEPVERWRDLADAAFSRGRRRHREDDEDLDDRSVGFVEAQGDSSEFDDAARAGADDDMPVPSTEFSEFSEFSESTAAPGDVDGPPLSRRHRGRRGGRGRGRTVEADAGDSSAAPRPIDPPEPGATGLSAFLDAPPNEPIEPPSPPARPPAAVSPPSSPPSPPPLAPTTSVPAAPPPPRRAPATGSGTPFGAGLA